MKKLLILLLLFFTTDSFASGIGTTATAPCDNDTLSKYSGTANVEIDWAPNTINLNWYNGDEKLTVANNAQSCVYDGTLTVPPQPTKPGYTFNGWKVIRVPGGFTELQYLESTGIQYIDTGYVYNSNMTAHIIIDTSFAGVGNSYWKCHGLSGSAFGGPNIGVSHTNKLSAAIYRGGDFITDVSAEANKRYLFDLNMLQKTFTVIDVATNTVLVNESNIPAAEYIGRPGFGLFGYYGRGPGGSYPTQLNSSKIYSAKLYDNNELVRNMIPARRDSDGVLGMYDSITGTFFTNAGTGTFTAGPAVQ